MNTMISVTYCFSQDCPVLFTLSLQGAMAFLSLLQFLKQLLQRPEVIQIFFCHIHSNQFSITPWQHDGLPAMLCSTESETAGWELPEPSVQILLTSSTRWRDTKTQVNLKSCVLHSNDKYHCLQESQQFSYLLRLQGYLWEERLESFFGLSL